MSGRPFLFAFLALAVFTAACSDSPDILLQGQKKPVAPQGPQTGGPETSGPVLDPSTGGSASDPSGSLPGGSSPATPSEPRPGPIATQPPVSTPGSGGSEPSRPAPRPSVRYRLFCEDRYPPYVNAISSLASPTGFGARISIGEPDAQGVFDPENRNLEYHEHPQPVYLTKDSQGRLLFSAARKGGSAIRAERDIFIADIHLIDRWGRAKSLGPELRIGRDLIYAAETETLSLRTFAVSDQGRYLLVGRANGYALIDSKTLREVGVIAVGSAALNFNPSLRESDMVFAVSSFPDVRAGTFETRLYSIGLSGAGTSRAAISSTKLISQTGALRRPLVAVSSRAGDAFAALDAKNHVAVVSPLKASGQEKAVKLNQIPSEGRLSSAMAFWREGGRLRAAYAFENIEQSGSGFSVRYKIKQVFVRIVELNESTLSSSRVGSDLTYPEDAQEVIERGIGIARVPGATELTAFADGKAIFGLFPGTRSFHVHRLTSSGLTRVSQIDCSNVSVGVEP